jgi:hypothetical protein
VGLSEAADTWIAYLASAGIQGVGVSPDGPRFRVARKTEQRRGSARKARRALLVSIEAVF